YTTLFRSPARSLRPFHLAGRRQRGRLALHLGVGLPAESRSFAVVFDVPGQSRDEQRLQQLVIVGAHFDLAERRRHFHAFHRARHLDRIVGLRLFCRRGEHVPHRLGAPVGVLVFLARVAFAERGDRRIELWRGIAVPFRHL